MTITIYLDPKSLGSFLHVTKILESLDVENNYIFDPTKINFSETFVPNSLTLNLEISEYLKFKYSYEKMT